MRLFIISVFLFLCFQLAAQPTQIQYIGTQQGLPSMTIYDILQDKAGFFWLATEAGAFRYNGQIFESFEKQGLPLRCASNVHEDKNGRIWILYMTGEIAYYDKGKVKYYNRKEINPFLKNWSYYYNSLIEMQDGTIWLSNKADFVMYIQGEKIHNIAAPRFTSLKSVFPFLLKTPQKDLLLSYQPLSFSPNQVWKINSAGISQSISTNILAPDLINLYIERKQAQLWAVKNILYKSDKDSMLKIADFSAYKRVIGLNWGLDEKEYFVCTQGDGFWHQAKEKSTRYFAGEKVSNVLVDKQGNWWVATLGKGLIKMQYSADYSNKSIAKRFEFLYPAHNASLYALGYTEIFQLNKQGENREVKGIKSDKRILGLGEYKDTMLFWGDAGAFYGKDKFPGLSWLQNVRSLDIKGDKCLMAASFSVNTWNFASKKEETCTYTDMYLRKALFISDTSCLLATNQGLFSWDLHRGQILFSWQNLHPALGDKILALYIENPNSWWIGTETNGLIHLQGKKIHIYDKAIGLAANLCKAITQTADGSIWVGHNKGISRLHPAKGKYTIETFSQNTGLYSNEILDILAHGDSLWIASAAGLDMFCWKDIPSINYYYKPSITVTHQEKEWFNVMDARYLYSENATLLTFDYPMYDNYDWGFEYRLNGESWQKVDGRKIELRQLRPGTYKIACRVSGVVGTFSPVREVQFEILPRWWQLNFFWGIIFFNLLSFTILLIANYYQQEQQKQEARLNADKEAVRLKSIALQNQMNPHFLFNSLQTLQNHILHKDEDKAIEYIGDFSILLRKMLHYSTVLDISLEDEIQFLQLYISLEITRF